MSTTTQRRPLTNRLVRPGAKVMKLDADKATGKARFPWQGKKRKRLKENRSTLQHLRRVGQVSMIQIGEDEFRTPNRKERRAAGIRRRQLNPLTVIARKKGLALLKRPVQLEPSVRMLESGVYETTPIGAARKASALLRARTYTRKQKLARKAIIEHNELVVVEAQQEQLKVCDLITRARGHGENPLRMAMEVPF
jgi:hypothetical protein